MNGQMQLSILVPVYNEADNVEMLYDEIVGALSDETYLFEVIFINDGSTDDTFNRLKAISRRSPHLKIVSHTTNYGQSAALVTGARAAQYPYLVTMDGDGQNDPRDIALLVASLDFPKTVVVGNRKKRDDRLIKRVSSWVGNTIRRRWLNDGCKDTGCSLKLFPRDAFLALPHFNHLHRFLPALFQRAGFRVVNVGVNHRKRTHGVSKYGVMNRLFVSMYDLMGVKWLLKRPCVPEVVVHES